jgi:DNA invertase Pin-like site-specific DNA recombinase
MKWLTELCSLVLAAVAKQERITISERTKAGLFRARRAGKQLGRRAVRVDIKAARKLQAEGLGVRGIAERLGISVNTLQKAFHRRTNMGAWSAQSCIHRLPRTRKTIKRITKTVPAKP